VTDPTVEARLLSSLSELEELLLELDRDRELAPPVSPPEPELTSDPPPELESEPPPPPEELSLDELSLSLSLSELELEPELKPPELNAPPANARLAIYLPPVAAAEIAEIEPENR